MQTNPWNGRRVTRSAGGSDTGQHQRPADGLLSACLARRVQRRGKRASAALDIGAELLDVLVEGLLALADGLGILGISERAYLAGAGLPKPLLCPAVYAIPRPGNQP